MTATYAMPPRLALTVIGRVTRQRGVQVSNQEDGYAYWHWVSDG